MKRFLLTLAWSLCIVSAAHAQLVLPRPMPPSEPRAAWKIESRHVDMRVRSQVASVTVTETLLNTCGRMFEADYLFPLPQDAAVSSLTLTVDGKEMQGELLSVDDARRYYEDIVRRQRDPALLEYAGEGLFRLSAFPLQPGKPVKVSLHYDQICLRDGDLTELSYPLATARHSGGPVEEIKVIADIEGIAPLATIYSPTLDLDIDQRSPTSAVVRYESRNGVPTTDFTVLWREDNSEIGATLLSYFPERGKDGYYMLLVSPSPSKTSESPLAKDIVLVLDRSGSMSGEKIIQARDAARFVVENLNPEDRFDVITYNDAVESCFDGMRLATADNRRDALAEISRIEAGGGTNIHDALHEAMSVLNNASRQASLETMPTRPAYVFFLTDGLPTVGITDEQRIIRDTRDGNDTRARLFCFGVGYDVNVRLLDNLSNDQNGRTAYVKPEENIETKVASLYAKVKNPVMSALAMNLEGFKLRDTQPSELGDLFEGDQIVQVGRISSRGNESQANTTLSLTGLYDGSAREFSYPVSINTRNDRASLTFIEKLWAQRRVAFLLNEIRLRGDSKELVDEIIELARRHGIVTPYTSYLADETKKLASNSEARIFIDGQATMDRVEVTGQVAQEQSMSMSEMMVTKQPGFKAEADGSLHVRGARNMAAGETRRVETIRVIGGETFYKRGDYWIAASLAQLDLDALLSQAAKVSLFSEDYFALVNRQAANENALLTGQKEGEKWLVALGGSPYLIE
ncbi:MAG: VWA domain-containing protein [Calditrichaeota bacterium]|nr:VWA domain-containing protein [Calditrichota bacterium]MCB9391431.1 VWA domain-containing protein [Calditrichota bacterium]